MGTDVVGVLQGWKKFFRDSCRTVAVFDFYGPCPSTKH